MGEDPRAEGAQWTHNGYLMTTLLFRLRNVSGVTPVLRPYDQTVTSLQWLFEKVETFNLLVAKYSYKFLAHSFCKSVNDYCVFLCV